MHLIQSEFNDFDKFNEFAVDWELDFKLLSRNNFRAYLNLYSNKTFQLGRTSLSGTIHQQGLVPKGFRTIVIPAGFQVSYNWLHKKVTSNNLLIFPKSGILESVSYDNFDVYVLSVEEERLNELLDSFQFINATRVFGQNEMRLFLDRNFLEVFLIEANEFLKFTKKNSQFSSEQNKKAEKLMEDQLMYKILKYIDESNVLVDKSVDRKRDVAMKKAMELICSVGDNQITIKDLCKICRVSERTLEYAFLEKYQVSPNQYIKAYRLNMVKNHLITRKGEYKRISDVASLYGFHHLSQFSFDFKRHFGVSPSKI